MVRQVVRPAAQARASAAFETAEAERGRQDGPERPDHGRCRQARELLGAAGSGPGG